MRSLFTAIVATGVLQLAQAQGVTPTPTCFKQSTDVVTYDVTENPVGECAKLLAATSDKSPTVNGVKQAMQTTEADCKKLYPFTLQMLSKGLNRLWKSYEVTTTDGYKLTVARIIGNNNGQVLPDDFGPVLLWHGEFGTGEDWMDTRTTTIGALPTRLFDIGYDVWIAWKRGTYPSKGHTDPTFDADYTNAAGAKKYWNFSSDEIGKNDLAAIVKAIHNTRGLESASSNVFCDQLQIVTHSAGAAELAIFQSAYPTDTNRQIRNVIYKSPCFYMDRTVLETPIAAVTRRRLAAEEILSEDHGRRLDHNRSEYDRLFNLLSGQGFWTPPGYANQSPEALLGTYSQYWNANYASRRSLYQQLRQIRDSLNSLAYRDFYVCYKNKRRSIGYNFKNNFNWTTPVRECVCEEDKENASCKPAEVTSMLSLFSTLETLGIYSIYGPKHKEQTDAICASLGNDSTTCCNFRKVVANFPQVDSNGASTIINRESIGSPARGEISVKQYYHLWQNAYNAGLNLYSDTWKTDGWCKVQTKYDNTGTQVYQYLQSPKVDAVCEKTKQQKYLTDNFNNSNNLYTQDTVNYGDARTHYNLVGDEDPVAYTHLYAQLGENIDTSTSSLFPFQVVDAAGGATDAARCAAVNFAT